MISKDCFTAQWLQEVSAAQKFNDKGLIEKVVRAMSLLEALVEAGCPLIFKGGSSLMLILKDSLHRLSIDVDVICPPGTDIEVYLKSLQDHGFLKAETIAKEHPGKDIPVSHSKVFYLVKYTDKSEPEGYIRLDVIYEDSPYSRTEMVPIEMPFLRLDGEPLLVRVPAKEDILGDKLTAFAPNTIGIPPFKGDRNCNLEIIKQMYDISRLFETVDDFTNTYNTFKKVSEVELGYRHLDGQIGKYFEDVRDTAMTISSNGTAGNGDFMFYNNGIRRIQPFMYQGRYYVLKAGVDAARAAYLATCFEKGITDIEKYDGNAAAAAALRLQKTVPVKLAQLRTANPEAFWYWVKISEILAQ